jgi:hypothetical protein
MIRKLKLRRSLEFAQHDDEWQDTDRRYLSEASMQLLLPTPPIPLPASTRTRKRPAAKAELATASRTASKIQSRCRFFTRWGATIPGPERDCQWQTLMDRLVPLVFLAPG